MARVQPHLSEPLMPSALMIELLEMDCRSATNLTARLWRYGEPPARACRSGKDAIDGGLIQVLYSHACPHATFHGSRRRVTASGTRGSNPLGRPDHGCCRYPVVEFKKSRAA